MSVTVETSQEKATRLKHKSTAQQLRQATETHEERATRLQHKSAAQQLRLAVQTPEERKVRLHQTLECCTKTSSGRTDS